LPAIEPVVAEPVSHCADIDHSAEDTAKPRLESGGYAGGHQCIAAGVIAGLQASGSIVLVGPAVLAKAPSLGLVMPILLPLTPLIITRRRRR